MGQSIVEIKSFGEALRNTGYKSIDSAIAEIIDNSIEAEAEDTFIIITEGINPLAKKKKKKVKEIAFLDNGIGMSSDVLGQCLGYGIGTRFERKGMGRFGVGLPQASMYACTRVEVYSWQDGVHNCRKVYLDINEVTDGTQTEISDPIKVAFPEKYLKYINYKTPEKKYNFSNSGTLVVWVECDRVTPKTIPYLKPLLECSLGQKFRYYIADEKQSIRIINYNNEEDPCIIKPNDPLFLLKNNRILGNPENPGSIEQKGMLETLFEPYCDEEHPDGIVKVPVFYWDRKSEEVKKSDVTVKFSKVKSKFYDKAVFNGTNPGNTDMGKEVKKMQGISIVRAKREIDFGRFDYFDNDNKPTHRWWGCEIIFKTELDEAFGVANNKQHVELQAICEEDYHDEEVRPIWLQLRSVIENTIKSMVKDNAKMQENSRTKKNENTPAEKIISDIEKQNDEDQNSSTNINRKNINEKEQKEKIKEVLAEIGNCNPTEEQIAGFKNSEIKILYINRGRGPFIDYDFNLGVSCIYINMSHDFYKIFVSNLIEDVESKTTFELFVSALVKAIDKRESTNKDAYDQLMTDWEGKLKKYIDAQIHPRSNS